MFGVTKEMTFEAAHRLLGYDGPCGTLHGHSYKVQVTVCSEALDSQGFVIDFSDLKSGMLTAFGSWDHATILHEKDPLVPVLIAQDQKVILFSTLPTAENMARLIYNTLVELKFNVSQVIVWETTNNSASVC